VPCSLINRSSNSESGPSMDRLSGEDGGDFERESDTLPQERRS
jgi:hypothetical protein